MLRKFDGCFWRAVFLGLAIVAAAYAPASRAEGYGFAAPGGYGLKIYRTNYALFPYVQVYFRTFDQNQQPLVNLNELNVGVMVKGRSYDPSKRQYFVQPLRQRPEAVRTVLVLDASKSMAGAPFNATLEAAVRYIAGKRPQDEIAVLSIRDTKDGYDVVSNFERDGNAVVRRLADIRVDGLKTRLYDSVAAAMQLCGMSAQGSESSSVTDVASCSIVVFSDGKDEGSALSREELNGRITNLKIPVPIYSVAYSKTYRDYFKNLESLSKNSFGVYFLIGDAITRMTQVMEQIQNILLSDYVVTFRSNLEVNGEQYAMKIGVEYPSGSGKFTYDSSSFEAIEMPPVQALREAKARLDSAFGPPVADPYFASSSTPAPSGTSTAPVPAGVGVPAVR